MVDEPINPLQQAPYRKQRGFPSQSPKYQLDILVILLPNAARLQGTACAFREGKAYVDSFRVSIAK